MARKRRRTSSAPRRRSSRPQGMVKKAARDVRRAVNTVTRPFGVRV